MTDRDRMDERLREYAARWRDATTAPVVDLERLGSRPHVRRMWWLVAASAAAVALVIAGGTRLVGDDSTRKPPPPAETVKPGDVVPWAPLPATHPQIPTETTPASPDPAEAAGQPECRASDLSAKATVGGAAGTTYLTVRLTLVGNQPCRLAGYPDLELMDRGHQVDIPLERQRDDSVYREPVLVAAGHPAMLRLGWASAWCTTPVHNDTIRLVLTGGVVSFPGFGGSPYCNGTAGSGPTPVTVETFSPVNRRDAKLVSMYAGVDVSGDLDVTASPGERLRFTVTLTSRQRLVLDPCPDYRITQNGADGPRAESHTLNCAAVPYKNDGGRPYLPAGTPVQFAMQATTGSPGAYKLGWELDTVDLRGVAGSLTVAADQGSSTAPRTRDDALRAALAADPSVIRETLLAEPRGQVLCGLHVLGSSASGDTLYLWLTCGDFVVVDGAATFRSGSSEPAVVRVRGSGTRIQVEHATFPRQQSLAADIKRLFPPSIADHIYDEESTRTSPSVKELEAEAVRNATS